MKSKKNLNEILKVLEDTGAEIISFGLAPNPSGFCFERGEDMSIKDIRRLSKLLDCLSEKEILELKRLSFE